LLSFSVVAWNDDKTVVVSVVKNVLLVRFVELHKLPISFHRKSVIIIDLNKLQPMVANILDSVRSRQCPSRARDESDWPATHDVFVFGHDLRLLESMAYMKKYSKQQNQKSMPQILRQKAGMRNQVGIFETAHLSCGRRPPVGPGEENRETLDDDKNRNQK